MNQNKSNGNSGNQEQSSSHQGNETATPQTVTSASGNEQGQSGTAGKEHIDTEHPHQQETPVAKPGAQQ